MSLDFLENNYQDEFSKYIRSEFAGTSEETITEEEPATNENGKDTGNNLYKPEKNKNKKQLAKKIINIVKKNKAVAYSGGGLGAITLIVIILVFLGAQQLPGFAALIAAKSWLISTLKGGRGSLLTMVLI